MLVNDSLRFPRRNGSTTVYLSQPEVRAAYFTQFIAEHDRAAQLEVVEADLLADLDTSTQVFAVVTLIPDLGGSMTIDTGAVKAFQAETIGRSPLITNISGINWMRAQVGPGRLIADGSRGNDQKSTWCSRATFTRRGPAYSRWSSTAWTAATAPKPISVTNGSPKPY